MQAASAFRDRLALLDARAPAHSLRDHSVGRSDLSPALRDARSSELSLSRPWGNKSLTYPNGPVIRGRFEPETSIRPPIQPRLFSSCEYVRIATMVMAPFHSCSANSTRRH